VPKKVHIITDSAADLPQELAVQRSIRIVPLYVTLGDATLKDGVELTSAELYRKMKDEKAIPRTSQPSPEDFLQAFSKVPEGEEILCLTISSSLSGTFQSAQLSKELLPDANSVTVYDSKSASLGEGLKALIAHDLAEQGSSVNEIITKLDAVKVRTAFTVEHMQYLERGGRVSKAQAAVATVLDIKPILTISEDGKIESETKVRGRQKSIKYLLELLEENLTQDYNGYICLSQANCPDEATKIIETIRTKYPLAKLVTGSIGAVIGSHTGPGCLALFFEEK